MKPKSLLAIAIVAQTVLAAVAPALADGAEDQVEVAPTRTGKERLRGKASDEQRVDNCKVPIDLRGSKPRPDQCRDGVDAAAPR